MVATPRRNDISSAALSALIDLRWPTAGVGQGHYRWNMARSVPRAKQSMRFAPQLTQFGPSRMMPPRFSQPPQAEPSHQRWNIARLVPRAKQSMRFGPQLTQFGSSRMMPPRFSQPPQAVPFHQR